MKVSMRATYVWLLLIICHALFGVYWLVVLPLSEILYQVFLFMTLVGALFVPFTYYALVGVFLWIGFNASLEIKK